MSKIAVLLALPIEYDTSSMLRCSSIIKALATTDNEIICYCPFPDRNNKYYNKNSTGIPGVRIVHYGKDKKNSNTVVSPSKKRSIKLCLLAFALQIFRRFDVFGSSLLYLPERGKIAKDIKNNGCDLLLSFSDPMPAHMIANYCKKKNPKISYIQQWGDPLANDTIGKVSQPYWIKKIIEKTLIMPADKVCYVSPFTYLDQKKIFPKYAAKMCFLPTPSLDYKKEESDIENLSCGYFGSYNSKARNIFPFYEAAKQNPDVKFFIIGDSDVHLDSTNNITVLNRVTQDELIDYMRKINVIVCIMNHKGNQIPGKIYHDASSSKDILLIKDGEYGDLIQEFFQKYNHYTFADNTVESLDQTIKNYKKYGVPMRKPVEEFTAKHIAEELITL